MSPLATSDPKELRPLLHARIDQCTDAELDAVRKALLLIEAKQLIDGVSAAVDAAYARGECTPEKLDESIREHRARHPYR